MFGYECNRRKRNPTKSFVDSHDIITDDLCDMVSFPEWKLDLMAKLIFSQMWGDQKEAILLACNMLSHCDSFQPSGSQLKIANLTQQIEKLEMRLKNYSIMRADGELSKEEFFSLSRDTNNEKSKLSDEIKQLQTQSANRTSTLDVSLIRSALNRMVDLSKSTVSEALLDEFVETITPVENYKFRWKLNFGESSSLNHTDLVNIGTDPILCFTIDFETAKRYREERDMDFRFRKNQWHDIKVEVYL